MDDYEIEKVIVSGAGYEPVNGVYTVCECKGGYEGFVSENSMAFAKGLEGPTRREQQEFFMFCSGTRRDVWFIADSTTYEMYYFCPSVVVDGLPPSNGWLAYENAEAPPPTIQVVFTIPTVLVAKPVRNAWGKVLFSDKHSDVDLVCQDGVILPAHKSFLAASSPYFNAAFGAEWKENTTGQLNIAFPSHIVKEVLTFLYTGNMDATNIKNEPLTYIEVAEELQLECLKVLVGGWLCNLQVDEGNVKAVWQIGHRFDVRMLKNKCVNYAKSNAVALLTEHDFTNLQNEDPESWNEFTKALKDAMTSE